MSLEAKGQQRVSMGAPLFEHGQLSAFSCRMQGASPAIPVLGGLALLTNHVLGRRALSGPEDELIAVEGLPDSKVVSAARPESIPFAEYRTR